MKFEEKLMKLRKQEGMSQEELAEKLDVTRQTVSKWELGQTKPDMDKLVEIGKVFNVGIEELTDDENSEESTNPTKEPKEKDNTLKIVLIVVGIIVGIIVIYYIVMGVLAATIFKGISSQASKIYDDAVKGMNAIEDASYQARDEFEKQKLEEQNMLEERKKAMDSFVESSGKQSNEISADENQQQILDQQKKMLDDFLNF
jgi:transcriptional regulator with XRE-family HTH domain